MPTATLPTLTADQISDLLYLARLGETADLTSTLTHLSKTLSTTIPTLLSATIDPASGNGLLHMASANGHTETLTALLSTPSSDLNINLQNAAGNTPLHWAAINGHLEAVRVLVGRGADVGVRNGVGEDAVFAAEGAERGEVVGWLLGVGRGVEGEGEGEGETGDEEGGCEEGEGEGGGDEGDVVMEEGGDEGGGNEGEMVMEKGEMEGKEGVALP